MLITGLRRIALTGFLLLCCVPAAFAQSIAGPQGGSYVVGTSGDLITSLSNDDGSIVEYQYDSAGAETGMNVSLGSSVSLALQYNVTPEGNGFVQAGSLPPLIWMSDAYGRTQNADLYPNMTLIGGEWYLDINGPDSIPVAFFSYGPGGHLSSVTLNSGLSMQLGTPTSAGVVTQSLLRPDGTVAATASPVGGTNGVTIVPAQLDAIATHAGLGANWAETLTFSVAGSGHLTIGRDAAGTAQVYLVDVGPVRVGYAADGTALFYDFVPTYTVGGTIDDPATQVAGVAPSHIVMTAEGATGFYTDQPAFGAVYSAWTETNASGGTDTRFATVEPAPLASRRVATNGRGGLRPRSDGLRRYKTVVCADEQCWERVWYEWVEDPPAGGGGPSGGGPIAPPSGGGKAPGKTGNQVVTDPKLRAKVDRALNKAKTKLQSQTCKALLNRLGIGGQKLIDVMNGRGYTDPGKYLTTHLTYVAGSAQDCQGNPLASTQVNATRVAVCSPFNNVTDGMAGVALIHEMMHTLGYGESPGYPGFPTSAQINQQVAAACGSN
jgi:YD repeat-containing protein